MATRKEKRPLDAIMKDAGRAFLNLTVSVKRFADLYIEARELYGDAGCKTFQDRFPLYTESGWDILEAIGRGRLLPQLWLCSRHFVGGLLKLKESLAKQRLLCSMSEDGKVEIEDLRSGETANVPFDELSEYSERCLLFGLAQGGDPDGVRRAMKEFRQAFRRASARARWEMSGDDIRISRRMTLTRAEWAKMGARMGWTLT